MRGVPGPVAGTAEAAEAEVFVGTEAGSTGDAAKVTPRLKDSTASRTPLLTTRLTGRTRSCFLHNGHCIVGEFTRWLRMQLSQNVSLQQVSRTASFKSPLHRGHWRDFGTAGDDEDGRAEGPEAADEEAPDIFCTALSKTYSFGLITARPPDGWARGALPPPMVASSFARNATGWPVGLFTFWNSYAGSPLVGQFWM